MDLQKLCDLGKEACLEAGKEILRIYDSGAPLFFLSDCSLPSFEKAKEIVRVFSPQLERQEVFSCRLRGERSVVETEFPSFS